MDKATVQWLESLKKTDPKLRVMLVTSGLVSADSDAELDMAIGRFIEMRPSSALNTVRNFNDARKKLTDFFGCDRQIITIKSTDALEWYEWITTGKKHDGSRKYSDATISKCVKRAKELSRNNFPIYPEWG